MMNNRLTDPRAWGIALATLLLRLLFGGLFAYYGWQKLSGYEQMLAMMGDPIGLGPKLSLQLVIFAEFFCGFFIVLGFLTRLSVIPIFITMIVAYFVAHANDPFQVKQVAFIFLCLCVVVFLLGSGRYSADWLLFRRKQ